MAAVLGMAAAAATRRPPLPLALLMLSGSAREAACTRTDRRAGRVTAVEVKATRGRTMEAAAAAMLPVQACAATTGQCSVSMSADEAG